MLKHEAGIKVVDPKAGDDARVLGQPLVEVIGVPAGDRGLVLVQGPLVDIEVLVRVQAETGEAALPLHIKGLREVVVRA